MKNWKDEPLEEVERLAKQNPPDIDALYEMAWRLESPLYTGGNDPVERCAWQDYWFEKAADAGHIDAKRRYGRSLIDRIMDPSCRKKAIKYFKELSDDFDSGKLSSKDDRENGAIGKLWLGVMLCEGYHTCRDAVKGAELIEAAGTFFNGFEGFGYGVMYKIGELYAQGLAKPGYNPSVSDLCKAIKYLKTAINRFKPEKDDPNNRGYLQLTKDYLDIQKERIKDHNENVIIPKFIIDEERRKAMEVSPIAQQRANADIVALALLRQRLSREGY